MFVFVKIGDLCQNLNKTEEEREGLVLHSHNIHLPNCNAYVFRKDYLKWPNIRDIWKLFHLRQKMKGEAQKIVSKRPLTNESFTTA